LGHDGGDGMAKDLTTLKIDRQNTLNNNIALTEIQKKGVIKQFSGMES